MKKSDMIARMSEATNITQKDCEAVYNAFIKIVQEEINTDTVVNVPIPNFGTLKVSVREEYESRNPKTGESITVPTSRVIRCSMSENMKKALDQNFGSKAKKSSKKEAPVAKKDSSNKKASAPEKKTVANKKPVAKKGGKK